MYRLIVYFNRLIDKITFEVCFIENVIKMIRNCKVSIPELIFLFVGLIAVQLYGS